MNTPLPISHGTTSVDDISAATLANIPTAVPGEDSDKCCLVQIYPADVVDGMHVLESPLFTAGRDAKCELRLPDSSVSRKHAELIKAPDGYVVRDLGSTNGTQVNGEQVTERRLQSGDILHLGCYRFKFLRSGSLESQYHETVYSAMTRDALTGTLNRRYLLETLQREVVRSRRQQLLLAVIMLDVDHFKQVNDNHGHLVGDEVLREFGRRLQSVCREDDLLARFGGEEFCICLFGATNQQTLAAAERFRTAVTETTFETTIGGLAVTASFGVASFDYESKMDSLELLRIADEHLYEAKDAGRNCVRG